MERATPILGLRHGVFTDQFIFRHILGHFFSRNYNLHHVYGRTRSIRYQKGKLNVIKRQKISFLGLYVLLTGLWNSKDIQNSCQYRSKNKVVRENAVTRAHGVSCSLWVIGSLSLYIQPLQPRSCKIVLTDADEHAHSKLYSI